MKNSSTEELEKLLHTYLDRAANRRDITKVNKNKIKRAADKTSGFLISFHGYLEAYSGVIQIMNGIPGAAGYGNVAYGALSLFLVVENLFHILQPSTLTVFGRFW